MHDDGLDWSPCATGTGPRQFSLLQLFCSYRNFHAQHSRDSDIVIWQTAVLGESTVQGTCSIRQRKSAVIRYLWVVCLDCSARLKAGAIQVMNFWCAKLSWCVPCAYRLRRINYDERCAPLKKGWSHTSPTWVLLPFSIFMGFDVTAKTRRLTNSQHTFLQPLGGHLPSGSRCYTSIRFYVRITHRSTSAGSRKGVRVSQLSVALSREQVWATR